MNTEQKAKAYDEAIERAEKALEVLGTDKCEGARQIFSLFPELKESEDERIRKALVRFHKSSIDIDGIKGEDILAWLEKQGDTSEIVNKKKIASDILRGAAINLITWIDYNAAEGNMCLSNMECKRIEDALVNGDWGKIYAYMKKKLEKQGEQKLVDKVEPKFKVGDWIIKNDDSSINIDYSCCKITKVENGNYTIESIYGYKGYNTFETFEKDYHLWTIKDAKDGDVLVYKDEISLYKHDISNCTNQETTFGGFVFHCCYDGKRFIMDSLYSLTEQDKMDIQPATKEQRDTLMKAMADAGWEFDFKKKALKKIHVIDEGKSEMDYCFTKMMNGEKVSPIWSEEDERMLEEVKFNFAYNKEKMTDSLITQYNRFFDKIKSLKPQPKQEWSEEDERLCSCLIEEQEESLDNVKKDKYGHSEIISDLKEMYRERIDWLKSLKQRIGG